MYCLLLESLQALGTEDILNNKCLDLHYIWFRFAVARVRGDKSIPQRFAGLGALGD